MTPGAPRAPGGPRAARGLSVARFGKVLRAHDFEDECCFCFAQAERLDPTEPRWPYYRGLTLVLSDPAKGLACLQRAVDVLGDGPLAPRFSMPERPGNPARSSPFQRCSTPVWIQIEWCSRPDWPTRIIS